jgi:hypothetical protein
MQPSSNSFIGDHPPDDHFLKEQRKIAKQNKIRNSISNSSNFSQAMIKRTELDLSRGEEIK